MFIALWSFLWASLQVNLSKYAESNQNWLVIELVIPKGHYVYGKKTDGSATPLAVTIEGMPDEKLQFECPVFDKEMELDIYRDNIIVLAPIGASIPKEVKVSYGMCTDIVCLRPDTITKDIVYDQLPTLKNDLFKRYKKLCEVDRPWTLLPILLAFLGGFLLNFMPCVLPVLSIKILSFLTHAETRFRSSLLYGLGNITTFVGLGLLTSALKTMGAVSGWGFHLQNPLFVFGLACLFVVMIMSILDLIVFPIFQTATPRSSFVTGVMTVIVGAPCTIPMMSTAVSYGLTQTALESILIFAALGIGMATPFLLLSIFPVRFLPKPGPWLAFVKPSVGFVLIITVLWLLQIYTALTSLDHFLIIGAVLVGISYLLWLWGQTLLKGWVSLLLGVSIIGVGVVQTLHRPLVLIPYSESVVTKTISDGKNVLIYATAKWCLTCKINGVILQKQSVQQALKDSNTVLITADYTQQDEDITLLLRKHNLAGVPSTILLTGDKALILPEILTESSVLKALAEKK